MRVRQNGVNMLTIALLALMAPLRAVGGDPGLIVLYSFGASSNDGINPGDVTFARNGMLYGVTGGGAGGGGTIFQLAPPPTPGGKWVETVLHNFYPLTDFSASRLAVADWGALFGTTLRGGINHRGNVFRLDPPETPGTAWTYHVLYEFGPSGSDGTFPYGPITRTRNTTASHALYGGTGEDGVRVSGHSCPSGVVYKLTPPSTPGQRWSESLYTFDPCKRPAQGFDPVNNLLLGQDGAVYGTTLGYKGSTVFRLVPPATEGGTWSASVLYTFPTAGASTILPGDITSDLMGGFYGTTGYGGAARHGTIYHLTPPAAPGGLWTNTTIYTFGTNLRDGAVPYQVELTPSGDLVGGTQSGGLRSDSVCGSQGCGTIFKIAASLISGEQWTFTVLHRFTGGADGGRPNRITKGRDGVMYGTAQVGGIHGGGIVFELTSGAAPISAGPVAQP